MLLSGQLEVAELSGWNGHLLMGVEVTGLSLRSVQYLEHESIFDIQSCSWVDMEGEVSGVKCHWVVGGVIGTGV